MSGAFKFAVSDALARSVLITTKPRDPALVAEMEASILDGTYSSRFPTKPATQAKWFKRPTMIGSLIGPHGETKRQRRVRDRTASRGRKRTMGGAGAMPHTIRCHYTEGERAALTVIALEVKRRGFCDWPIDKIAAVAGVSKRTVQYALATASAAERAHIKVERRPMKGRRNKTNIITIIAEDWTTWLKRGPSLSSINRSVEEGIGCKEVHGTKKGYLYSDKSLGGNAFSNSAERGRDAARGLGMGRAGKVERHLRCGGAA